MAPGSLLQLLVKTAGTVISNGDGRATALVARVASSRARRLIFILPVFECELEGCLMPSGSDTNACDHH